jgi:hydrogenase maturation protease
VIVPAKILIAGIGNIFFGDDAFGCEVAQRLVQQTWPPEVRVGDFGIRGIDLAYALADGCELAILIDATPRGGTPGDLYVIEPTIDSTTKEPTDSIALWDAHTMNPEKVLCLAASFGDNVSRVIVVGCEPTMLGPEADIQAGLSEPVQAAIGSAVRLTRSLVTNYLVNGTIDCDDACAEAAVAQLGAQTAAPANPSEQGR